MPSINSFVSVEVWDDKRVEQKTRGSHIVQKLILEKKKKVHDGIHYDIHWMIDFNADQSKINRLLFFCWRLYDEAQDFWKKRFPGCTDYIIIQEKIPKFLKDFFEVHLPRIGTAVSRPKTKEELETWEYFQLGWYRKDGRESRRYTMTP